jgi:hypothetical protein
MEQEMVPRTEELSASETESLRAKYKIPIGSMSHIVVDLPGRFDMRGDWERFAELFARALRQEGIDRHIAPLEEHGAKGKAKAPTTADLDAEIKSRLLLLETGRGTKVVLRAPLQPSKIRMFAAGVATSLGFSPDYQGLIRKYAAKTSGPRPSDEVKFRPATQASAPKAKPPT